MLVVDYELGKVLDYLRFVFLNYSSSIGLGKGRYSAPLYRH
jgi:hypothetical protein